MKKTINKAPESQKTIERICLYRQILMQQLAQKKTNLFSHELARLARVSPSQIRRDLMSLECAGSPNYGYDIAQLLEQISDLLRSSEAQNAAIVGVGNLGRAIMSFFYGKDPKLKIVSGFDVDDHLTDRVIHGCECHHINDIEKVVKEKNISVGIITVPESSAQDMIDRLCSVGVTGILNFAQIKARVPDGVFIEDVSLSIKLDVVAYYAKSQ
jgi:redox-sensing transcriptional repressor